MAYSSFDIAKKFLELAKQDNRPLDPMKLIKLVYISHGWHLGYTGEPLVLDEVQAWQYGPVIPQLYHVTKRFGTRPVDPALLDLYSDAEIDEDTLKFLDVMWSTYGKMSAIELSARTHEEGTAWDQVYTGAYHEPISNDVIEAHYKEMISSIMERMDKQPS